MTDQDAIRAIIAERERAFHEKDPELPAAHFPVVARQNTLVSEPIG